MVCSGLVWFFPCLWMEWQGDQHKTKSPLSDRNHHRTSALANSSFLQINQHCKIMPFQPYVFVCLFVCFMQTGFCRKGLLQRKQRHCTNQELSWALEQLGSCLISQQMRNGEKHRRRRRCTLQQRLLCPTSNLALRYRATTAALWVQWGGGGGGGGQRLGGEGQQENSQKTPWESSFSP